MGYDIHDYLDDVFEEELDSLREEVPGPEDICYLGHEWCYDRHESTRLADEADWLDEERYGL